MAIKSGQVINISALSAATDLTILGSGASEIKEVYTLSFHDYGTAGATIEVFLSLDETSAAAERIDVVKLGAGQTKTIGPIGVDSARFLIAKSDAGSINVYGLYTLRNGADI